MVVGIEECAKTAETEYRLCEISETHLGKGVPTNAEFVTNIARKLALLKNDDLKQAKKHNEKSTEYKSILSTACQQFRICVEKSVEDILLNEVVRRFRRNIVTKNRLKSLSKISLDDCRFIESMMTKYSFTEHSQPTETPLIQFDIEQIESDIDQMIKWIESFKSRPLGSA